jgi:Eukaryotic cytochrome b561
MDMFHWLLIPVSGSATHEILPWASWHARMMVMGWAVLLPLGVLAARFFKVLPRQDWPAELDNKLWWRAHRGLQYAGVLCMLVGVLIAWGNASAKTDAAIWHVRLGWLVLAMGGLQVVAGLLRGSKGGPSDVSLRGDHYDMTLRRRIFEWLHKLVGYAAMLLAVAVILLGLAVSDAPRWMWLVLFVWWCGLVGVFVLLQRRGWCIDTYQAIWGPDTQTQASDRPAIGWGIQRYTSAQWRQKFRPTIKTSDTTCP